MSMQDDLIALKQAKEEVENWAEEIAEIEKRLIDSMERAGQKSVSANGGDLTGTLVKSSVMVTDEAALKKKLTAKEWKSVIKEVVDKERLEAAVVAKTIDPVVVASVSKEVDRKPYIRVTGTHRQRKTAKKAPAVSTRNSQGQKKPAARRVRRPKKTS